MMSVLTSAQVEAVVREVCHLEVRALKPGNVSTHAPGHGMRAEDFFRSADIIAPLISAPDLRVGERIQRSVEASVAAVGCNTNLGIVLLLAPLVQAVTTRSASQTLRERLGRVLADLTVADARAAYAAIRVANPGGLGNAPDQDVSMTPAVTLLEAMRLAAHRDRIAHQYSSVYEDVFEQGVPALRMAIARGWNEEWAAVACYLHYLAAFTDTHVVRKFGTARAEALRRAGVTVETHIKACDNPRTAVPMLLKMDEKLKREGINPGTSADLVVATLTACRFETLLSSS